jgi:hypothetical protein
MSIYVDPVMNHGWRMYGKVVTSCHLFTDGDVEELHKFAAWLGLKREWFQVSNSGIAHYDLVNSKRLWAVKLGAIEVTRGEAVEIWRQIRELNKSK